MGPADCTLGVDVGGTKVAGVVVHRDGRGDSPIWELHGSASLEQIIDRIVDMTARLVVSARSAGQDPSGVGISIAGLVDGTRGVVVHAARLGMSGLALADVVADRTGMAVVIDNDANCTLRAIQASRLPEGSTSVLFAMGTGLGGAIAVDGTVVLGRGGLAGELGHLTTRRGSDAPCVCGRRGCLETMASGTGIERLARQASGVAPSIVHTAESVVARARAREPGAMQVIRRVGEALGTAIADLTTTLDPDVVFFSGTVGHSAGDLLVPVVEQTLLAELPFVDFRDLPHIRTDPVGPLAAAVGAGLLAMPAA